MADIAGALRSIIQSIFHLSNAHEQLASTTPTGSPMGAISIARAHAALDAAQAALDGPEPADQVTAAVEPPPEAPPADPPPPPAPPEDQANPDPAQPAESTAEPSADALNTEEAASNPTGDNPPQPPVS